MESVSAGDEIKGVCEKISVENIWDDLHSKDTKKRRNSKKETEVNNPSIIVKIENILHKTGTTSVEADKLVFQSIYKKKSPSLQLSTMSFQMETVEFMQL